ncbi:MAG: hypothetical protein ACYDA3_05615 [Gaiellaceae bacterium]
MSDKNAKRILIWAFAHIVIASLVIQEMRKRGKTEQDARKAGHAAGTVAGFVLSSALL